MENENLDKKVLVTGASGGIGRAIAVEAAKAGYYVICHYNGSQGKAEETLAQIQAVGGQGVDPVLLTDRDDPVGILLADTLDQLLLQMAAVGNAFERRVEPVLLAGKAGVSRRAGVNL